MIIGRLRQRWRRWIDRRIPRSDDQQFTQKNIFILPSGAGVVFGILLVVMLLTGINYQNSLIYLLTFILGALFVAAMHQTHSNLSGLHLALVEAGEGFPGEPIAFRLRATAKQAAFAIRLAPEQHDAHTIHVDAGAISEVELATTGLRRGPVQMADIRVDTRFPFGLLTAWSWMRPQGQGVVYPKPVMPPYEPGGDAGGETSRRDNQTTDMVDANIRPWRQGDLSQRVLWKRYARTGEMVIAEWEGEHRDPQWLDYDQFPGADRELRLSYLAALVESRSHDRQPFGLVLPGQTIEPDSGPLHRQRCLRALGRFGFDTAPEGASAA
ncbi:DUF58 domain-containing protein [Marinobacter sp. JSM 1782161]|uniref:DUF58 domain-containing protein n=1 Tax=Marinobacter sp. JSM 1782161 TaxID=2685906 RepID=UPI001402AA2D|nr:DUF58 domain-containing protein [Marinobacter sp. JSM 1782161]